MVRILGDGEPDPRSILVILPTWVGDFVMATPTLRAIRSRFEKAEIVFLHEPNLRELIQGGGWMDECVEWRRPDLRSAFHKDYRDLVASLRRRRFDWCVLLPNSFRSALLGRLIGAKRVIGYARDGRRVLLTDPLKMPNRGPLALASLREDTPAPADPPGYGSLSPPAPPGRYSPMPLVDYFADLAEALGCDRPDDDLELFETPQCAGSVEARLAALGLADRSPLIVLSPGAKFGAAKCWPAERFAAVADEFIQSDGAAVIVTCGPGEQPIARGIAAAMRESAHVFDSPLLSLGELKSLIRRCDLLVCNDAGPRHFAKAFDVPVVTVFGPTHPRWTDTRRHRERIVRIDVDCGPCQQRVCPLGHLKCMTGVTVEMVAHAGRQLLKTNTARSHG